MELKLISGTFLLVLVLATVAAADSQLGNKASAKDYAFNATCMEKVQEHIQREFGAAVTYLAMVKKKDPYQTETKIHEMTS